VAAEGEGLAATSPKSTKSSTTTSTTTSALNDLIAERARFTQFERHGKNLFLGFGARTTWIWSHLGMTGKWLRRNPGESPPRFSRAVLTLDDGVALHFCDQRRFGTLEALSHEERTTRASLASLGPDLLARGLSPKVFADRLLGRKVAIKPLLLDQTCVAGVGNIQASEGLFRARLDPRLTADQLGRTNLGPLLKALRESCKATLAAFDGAAKQGREITYVEEAPGANPFLVYGREGHPCPRCGAALVRFAQGGRSTFYCPPCQKAPR
jgi:formamidopyrimidine-DNA glycosylase